MGVGCATGMVKLEQFIIHRRKFVLEPYRRKGGVTFNHYF